MREVDQAIMVTDAAGTISFWNAAAERLYGWTEAEVLGRNATEIFGGEYTAAEATAIMECLAAGETWEGEFVLPRRDGSTFTALVTDTPILGDDGGVTAIIGLSRDVSEIRAMENALASSEGQFRALPTMTESKGRVDRRQDLDVAARPLERALDRQQAARLPGRRRSRQEELVGRQEGPEIRLFRRHAKVCGETGIDVPREARRWAPVATVH